MLGSPLGTTSERNLNSLFIMNSAGEDEEQVDYGEDSGGEKKHELQWAGALHHVAADAVLTLHSG